MTERMLDDYDENDLFGKGATGQKTTNPLSRYFRVPGLHIKLPTQGAYLPQGALDLTMADELPVYPMRAADELLMRSPDALMSGYAVEKMLESCVPAIKTPRLISTPDLDVLLLAIRAASYGNKMDIEVPCPSCETRNSFECDIPDLLGTVTPLPPDNAVRLSAEVVAYIRPFNLENATKVALAAFNEARAVQAIEENEEISDEMVQKAINESYRRMSELNLHMTADCILKVVTPEAEVTDKSSIAEFVNNIPREWSKKIDEALKRLNSAGVDRRLHVQCSNCNHQWDTEVEFDPASFFALGS